MLPPSPSASKVDASLFRPTCGGDRLDLFEGGHLGGAARQPANKGLNHRPAGRRESRCGHLVGQSLQSADPGPPRDGGTTPGEG